jgi:hypothetical protein
MPQINFFLHNAILTFAYTFLINYSATSKALKDIIPEFDHCVFKSFYKYTKVL